MVAGAFRDTSLPGARPTEDVAEAVLVDRLREDGDLVVSLVAEVEGVIVGHVALSPVTWEGERSDPPALGLAPLAVVESQRGIGIGGALVTMALERARSCGAPFVVVLGRPDYYARFGFVEAEPFGLDSVYDAGSAFRVCELAPGAVTPGLVRYAAAFEAL